MMTQKVKPTRAKSKSFIRLYDKHAVPCYLKTGIVFSHGKGCWLTDTEGRRYLDFFSGWAVSGLGHCHPAVVNAVKQQVGKLIHVPNNYYHEMQALLAQKIVKNAFPGKVFFCNSGTEAVEAAIKLARIYGQSSKGSKRYEIIAMKGSFHGRTMGSLSATGQSKFHQPVRPVVSGFKFVEFNNLKQIKKAISSRTVAVLLELIQGEGGVRIASREYVRALRKICDQKNILMIVDEVQTGVGRTGQVFCFKHYGIKPDVMLLAKGLGGGFPVGALVAGQKVKDVLTPGTHASTFGGNPLACAAVKAVLDNVTRPGFMKNVDQLSKKLLKELSGLKKKYSIIREVRGKGFLVAIELSVPAKPVVDLCLENKLLINATQNTVLRFAPPLIIRQKEINQAIRILDKALSYYSKSIS